MSLNVGDRVTAQGFPPDYPLAVLAIVGGRIAIGSPRWPKGANHPVDYSQITSINGVPVAFPQLQPQPSTSKRRKAA
jgi:hypothetical protein